MPVTISPPIEITVSFCTNRDVDIFHSTGAGLVDSVPCGGSFDIPTHTVIDTDGVTVFTDEFDVDRVCTPATPVNLLTCTELNDGLNQAQRDSINQIQPLVSGCTTSVITNDDGDLEPGRGGLAAGYGGKWFTRGCLNEFGNFARFTSTLGEYYANPLDFGGTGDPRNADGSVAGGAIYVDDLVIDHANNRMYSLLWLAGAHTDAQIAAAAASAFGGFNDWRLSNIPETVGLNNYERVSASTVVAMKYWPFVKYFPSLRMIWLNLKTGNDTCWFMAVQDITGTSGGYVLFTTGSAVDKNGLLTRDYS